MKTMKLLLFAALAALLLLCATAIAEPDPFINADLTLDGRYLPDLTSQDIYAHYGAPDSVTYNPQGDPISALLRWTYNDTMDVTYRVNASLLDEALRRVYENTRSADQYALPLANIEVSAAEITGPRGVKVGMTVAEALALYGMDVPEPWPTKTLYGDAGDEQTPPCAYARWFTELPGWTMIYLIAAPDDWDGETDWHALPRSMHAISMDDDIVTSFRLSPIPAEPTP